MKKKATVTDGEVAEGEEVEAGNKGPTICGITMAAMLWIRYTLIEPMLGTKALNPKVFAEYIAKLAANELDKAEEIAASDRTESLLMDPSLSDAERAEMSGTSVFHRNKQGQPIIWDYQVKGHFKAACTALRKAPGSKSEKVQAYQKMVHGNLFVAPRCIRIVLPEGATMGVEERPIRVQGPQGERVALVRSESVPAGSTLDMQVLIVSPSLKAAVMEWMSYGAFYGLGQWRNSGMGRFTWEEVPAEANFSWKGVPR